MNKHDWHAAAFVAFCKWARNKRKPYAIEQARIAIGERIEAPADLRWWGAVTQAALRDGVIRRVPGWHAAVSSHGAPKPVYVSGRA